FIPGTTREWMPMPHRLRPRWQKSSCGACLLPARAGKTSKAGERPGQRAVYAALIGNGRVGQDFRAGPVRTRRSDTMATTMQTANTEATKQLVNYRGDGGVAVIEMCDPPANTYTYEMNRQLDDAILKARMDNDAYVIVLTGAGDKFFSA